LNGGYNAASKVTVIKLSNLEFRYAEGEFRLSIPELYIDRGTTAAVIGPSGCGKTTLLNLIAGVTEPLTGRITTNEVELTSLSDSERRNFRIRNIGLVFQEFELLEYLSVLDNILLPYRINRSMQLTASVRDRATELANQVGIGDKISRYATKLSQGEKQRVAVCRALLPDPVLLLADEPTGNLDPSNKGRVLDILLDYAARVGATLVTVTHDYDLIDRFDGVIDFRDFHHAAGAPGSTDPEGA
jgi:ABC-type lipoprotein export system ATPase subunit